MASLPESSTFDAGVYQLELTDPVIGGPSGVSNAPLKNLANRTKYLKDHVDALESSRAPLASPSFTGTPTAPTPASASNDATLATTAFVKNAVAAVDLSSYAPKASPSLTGTPTAPTAAQGTNTIQLATTAFVNAEIAADAAPASHVGAAGNAHGVATGSVNGFMSAADKAALDGVVSGFSNGLAASGFQKLPGGLIIQWGSDTVVSSKTITFPVAFPVACASVQGAVDLYGTPAGDEFPQVGSVTKTSFLANPRSINYTFSGTFYWIAIGY